MMRARGVAAAAVLTGVYLLTDSAVAETAKNPYLQRRRELVKELDTFDIRPLLGEGIYEEGERARWPLTLQDVTQLILENNINIKISHLDLDSAKRDIAIEKSEFYPVATFSADQTRSRTPNATGRVTTLGETVSYDASIEKKFFTGATVTLDGDVNRSGRKHAFTSGSAVTVSQPILEGAGPHVVLAPIKISQINYEIAVEDLKQSLINEITDAQVAYWEILNAREALRVRRLSQRQAAELVVQAKRELDLGRRTFADVLQAQASAASREEEVLQAENNLRDREDELKELLNRQAYWGARIVIRQKIELSPKLTPPEIKPSLETALRSRPDYRTAIQRLQSQKITRRVARNALLPDLSLDYHYQLSGAGKSARDSVNNVFASDFPDWGFSTTLTIPWLDKADWEDYQKTLNELKQRQLAILDLQLQIIREVRSAVRGVKNNIKRVKTASLAYKLQQKKVEAAQKKYEVGLATSFEALEFQEDLANAGVARIRSLVDYHQSLIRLWRVLGTTLENNNIIFEPYFA